MSPKLLRNKGSDEKVSHWWTCLLRSRQRARWTLDYRGRAHMEMNLLLGLTDALLIRLTSFSCQKHVCALPCFQ